MDSIQYNGATLAIGDDVSFGFNGDYYPCGKIKSISKTGAKIVTTDATVFNRNAKGKYRNGGTWALVKGIVDKRNPSF